MSIDKVEEILKNGLPGRESYFKLKHFIIGKEPTHQGKMWKILAELKTRKEAVKGIDREIEEMKDNRKLMEIRVEKMDIQFKQAAQSTSDTQALDAKEIKIRKRQMDRQFDAIDEKLESLTHRRKNVEDEIEFFVKYFEMLHEHEELKDYDDVEAQTEYWNAKLAGELNLRTLLGAPVDMDIVNSALSLPDDAPIKKATLYIINEKTKAIQAEKIKQVPVRED